MKIRLPGAKKFLEQFPPTDLQGYVDKAIRFTRVYHEPYLCLICAHLPVQQYTPSRFLADYTWIILCSGFDSRIIHSKFDSIGKLLCNFDTQKITRSAISKGAKILNHKAKWGAITQTAWLVKSRGWGAFKEEYLTSVDTMSKLPRIGEITKYRLGLCTGLDVVGPSEHMTLTGDHFSIQDPQLLCRNIQVSIPSAQSLYLCQIEFCLQTFLSHQGKPQECCFTSVSSKEPI